MPDTRVVCSAGVRVVRVDYSEPGHPRNVHADGSLCDHFPRGVSVVPGRDPGSESVIIFSAPPSQDIPGSNGAGVAGLSVTQRFVIEDSLLCCAGCGECLTENRIEHQAGCSEMRFADLLAGTADGAQPGGTR